MDIDSHDQRFPTKIHHLPDEECYVILTTTTQTIPGDLRSQTHPGHGYPAHTVHNWDIRVFEHEEEWEKEVLKLHSKGNRYFKACRLVPAKITTKVEIEQ